MVHWMNLGQMLKINAKQFSNKIALKEKNKSRTYNELNQRVNKLAHSLLSLGLKKGDHVAVLLENCIEIVEVYLATAKTGIIIVPLNFRLSSNEIEFILVNSDTKAIVVHNEFTALIDPIKKGLKNIASANYLCVGKTTNGYMDYEKFISNSPDTEPNVDMSSKDTWILLYTSGTTGKPKGVVRSHESYVAFYFINAVEFGFDAHDICLNIMPLCHVNSTFYTFLFLYLGGSAYIHPAQQFKADEILEVIEREKITFISLIPTHYQMILNASEKAKKFDRSSIKKLLCSSAPVRKNMKLAIMDFFPGVGLFEAYGSTEAGMVTVLKPEDQMKKLGSIGLAALGTDFIKILDEKGNPVGVDEVGELYSKGPMLFDKYHNLPEKTLKSFKGDWFSAGDMGKFDKEGYYYIVDRKDNMIITGGEHVYPTEVEEVIGSHSGVFEVAVIGLPDEKWGEKVTAVIVPKTTIDANTILDYCKDKLTGYKRPKEIIFIKQEEMPRTASGKIMHRLLRERYGAGKEK